MRTATANPLQPAWAILHAKPDPTGIIWNETAHADRRAICVRVHVFPNWAHFDWYRLGQDLQARIRREIEGRDRARRSGGPTSWPAV